MISSYLADQERTRLENHSSLKILRYLDQRWKNREGYKKEESILIISDNQDVLKATDIFRNYFFPSL